MIGLQRMSTVWDGNGLPVLAVAGEPTRLDDLNEALVIFAEMVERGAAVPRPHDFRQRGNGLVAFLEVRTSYRSSKLGTMFQAPYGFFGSAGDMIVLARLVDQCEYTGVNSYASNINEAFARAFCSSVRRLDDDFYDEKIAVAKKLPPMELVAAYVMAEMDGLDLADILELVA